MRTLLAASLTSFALLASADIAPAQVKLPKPPDTYDATIRYRILADRNERVLQFEAMTKFLGGLGFKETVTDESDLAPFDPNAETLIGTVPSRTSRNLLKDGRVQTILLAPAGFKVPEAPDTRVRIAIELASSREQLALFNQAEAALNRLGFRKDLGFDTRKFTLLRGTVPAGNLPKLLRDLRYQPSGWLLPETPPELYGVLRDGSQAPELVKPFGDAVPVRVVEILGGVEDAPAIVTLPPIPADQLHLAKWTADLRRKLAEEGARDKPLRLEVVLANAPIENDPEWRRPLDRIGAAIEGRVGTVVSLSVPQGSKAADIAALPDVASVRLPRVSSGAATDRPAGKRDEPKEERNESQISTADEPKLPAPKASDDPLKLTGLDRLHAADKKGQGVRVVIIDTDFAGWEQHVAPPARDGKRGPRTEFVDLTAERNRDVRPDPMPGNLGHGTHCALAVRLAAPMADLVLVRVPPDAPYHVINVARSIRGDEFRTEGMITRRQEVESDFESIRLRRRKAQDEYRRAFESFEDDPAARQRRLAAQKALKDLDDEEAALLTRMDRVDALEQALGRVRGAQVVVSLIHWNTGFPLDAASTVSRFLDNWLTKSVTTTVRALGRPSPPPPPLWFQPAGDTRGQTWTGTFRDADRNGVMEFATDDVPLKPGRWSRELNFLAVESDGKDVLDLHSGSKVRISVQWREPHDPSVPEVDYRVPVAPIKLQLVKQRDPKGEKYASDEIDLVAESEGLPARLHIEPMFGVYEHSLEITIPTDGRYAIRVEGRVPTIIRPPNVPTLQDQEVRWELRPRLFVESADGKGKFSLADFSSEAGGVAVAGDARSVLAVGAADSSGKPRPYSAAGAGPVTELLPKPDLLAPDGLPRVDGNAARGTALAASFAAGWAASYRSATGQLPVGFPQSVGIPKGGLIAVPAGWSPK
jgi:hypothetical protein